MKRKKNFSNFSEASEFLGEDFWEVMTDVLPFIGPRMDVYRTAKEWVIIAEIPGIKSKEDFSINLQGQMLFIEGVINRPYLDEDCEVIQDERFHGSFKRKVRVPEECIHEKLKASYLNGLLEVRIPLYEEDMYPKHKVPVQFMDEDQWG
jgi:HSP20 family protein